MNSQGIIGQESWSEFERQHSCLCNVTSEGGTRFELFYNTKVRVAIVLQHFFKQADAFPSHSSFYAQGSMFCRNWCSESCSSLALAFHNMKNSTLFFATSCKPFEAWNSIASASTLGRDRDGSKKMLDSASKLKEITGLPLHSKNFDSIPHEIKRSKLIQGQFDPPHREFNFHSLSSF